MGKNLSDAKTSSRLNIIFQGPSNFCKDLPKFRWNDISQNHKEISLINQ